MFKRGSNRGHCSICAFNLRPTRGEDLAAASLAEQYQASSVELVDPAVGFRPTLMRRALQLQHGRYEDAEDLVLMAGSSSLRADLVRAGTWSRKGGPTAHDLCEHDRTPPCSAPSSSRHASSGLFPIMS